MTLPSFSAALLAGGQSTRMGRDKALLTLPGSDLPLWHRQWRVLQELQPDEMFWSGPIRPGLPENIRIISDKIATAGPLAGISACLDVSRSDLLVVLAIDLPEMTAAFLRDLLTHCSTDCGAVVRHGIFFEPLAAVYPRQLQALASDHLSQGRYAMQDLVREAITQGLLRDFPLDEKDAALFKNMNNPSDWPGLSTHRVED